MNFKNKTNKNEAINYLMFNQTSEIVFQIKPILIIEINLNLLYIKLEN